MLSALKKPKFLVFSITQSASLFGDKLDYMAMLALFAWLSARGGWDQSRAIATLAVVGALPTVIFAPAAGLLVDRWDRRKVMIACDSVRVLLVAAMPFVAAGLGSMTLIYAIAFSIFLCGLLFNTARMSILPGLVDAEEDLGSQRILAANSFINLTGRIATLLGMVLGGLIVDWSGWARIGIRPSWSAGFYVDALTYLVSVVGLIVIYRQVHAPPCERPLRSLPEAASTLRMMLARLLGVFTDLGDAWKLIGRTPSLLFVYASTVAFVALGAGVLVLFIPIIQLPADAGGLGLGTRGVGLVAGAGSVGLILSSVGYGAIGHRVKKHAVVLAAFLACSVCAVVLSFTSSVPIVMVGAAIAGLGLSPIYIATDTLVHESVPAGIRGRVFSNREWVLHVCFAINAFLLGQLTRVVPRRSLLLVIGALVGTASVVGFFVTRKKNVG
ncbi:MFS transporter [candidate division WOR-3 bacterium]|nr:MFS transporter [candidate division WOR-3 bacterium]